MPSITNFIEQFTTELSRQNRFEVFISPPSDFGTGINIEKLTFRCESANLPGRHLTTVEQKTFGPYERFPVHTTFTDIDLTFIVDGDMAIKTFFDAWVNSVNPTNSFTMNYKSDYATDIVINQYDVTDLKSYSVTLIDAFPVNTNQLDLNWSTDGIHKLVVTFAYTYWINDTQSSSTPLNSLTNEFTDKFNQTSTDFGATNDW